MSGKQLGDDTYYAKYCKYLSNSTPILGSDEMPVNDNATMDSDQIYLGEKMFRLKKGVTPKKDSGVELSKDETELWCRKNYGTKGALKGHYKKAHGFSVNIKNGGKHTPEHSAKHDGQRVLAWYKKMIRKYLELMQDENEGEEPKNYKRYITLGAAAGPAGGTLGAFNWPAACNIVKSQGGSVPCDGYKTRKQRTCFNDVAADVCESFAFFKAIDLGCR
ncbi:hypothetical protein GcC1_212012 [Golovinomyces cichoracearum]|uniref:Uncharacterized protein n=1 Tax=Golovinomyces cichoracearum TaxID=62708 RepID=A0A420HA79_9PEZI|nr:hypothetical protein GcC1_212012 [Golovinomyces cichoracearum]